MRVPVSWLREYVDLPDDLAEITDLCDRLGLVVDGVDAPGAEVSGVVAAEILAVLPHPNADRLQLADVRIDEGDFRVVCGAPNIAAGQIVPWARPGATLPGGMKLKKAKIRGEASEGMLCSARELGLGDDHEGILVLPAGTALGGDVKDLLGLDEVVLDLDVTPNRPDAMSVVGVARDLAAVLDTDLRMPAVAAVDTGHGPSIELDDPDGCPRYCGAVIDVSIGASPDWLVRRLEGAGMRSINNVVDITNFVMLELGQPLHAFDLDRLSDGSIRVRRARVDETMTTLDGVERNLEPTDVLICDGADVPQAVAGVMGGHDAEVSASTTTILLESAYFDAPSILQTSKRLGLRSDASSRFERGTDPNGVLRALARAVTLFEQLANGRLRGPVTDVYPVPVKEAAITVRPDRVRSILGTDVDDEQMVLWLTRLGLSIETRGTELHTLAPTWRPDLTREIDIVEEVARLAGFNSIARTVPHIDGQVGKLTDAQLAVRSIRAVLRGAGCDEIATLSLLAESDLVRCHVDGLERVTVTNPLRFEESILRPSLLPGVLRTVAFNQSHGSRNLALFEMGRVFARPTQDTTPRPLETQSLAVAMVGSVDERPYASQRDIEFFDLVGVIDRITQTLRIGDLTRVEADFDWLQSGRSAALSVGDVAIGWIGQLEPDVVSAWDIEGKVVACQLSVDALLSIEPAKRWYAEPSRFPASRVDLAFVMSADDPVAPVVAAVRAGSPLVSDARLIDSFEGGSIGDGMRSVAVHVVFRSDEATLNDDQIRDARQACIDAALSVTGVSFRR